MMVNVEEFKAIEKNIFDIFLEINTYYHIPIYQRRYDWGNSEVSQLINDLEEFHIKNENNIKGSYYLGNIIVKPKINKYTKIIEYEKVIDGQQRLTTLLLFFKHLKNQLNKIKDFSQEEKGEHNKTLDSFMYSYVMGEKTKILKVYNRNNDNEINDILISKEIKIKKTNSNAKYVDNLSIIENKVEIKNRKEYDKWFSILKKIKLVKVTLGEFDNEIAIFESINSRGKSLNLLDLIKNYFFLHLEQLDVTEEKKQYVENIISEKIMKVFINKSNIIQKKEIYRYIASFLMVEKGHYVKLDPNELYKSFKEKFKEEFIDWNSIIRMLSNLLKYSELIKKFKNMADKYNSFEYDSKKDFEFSLLFLLKSKMNLYMPLLFLLEKSMDNKLINEGEYFKIIKLLDFLNIAISISPKVNKDNKYWLKLIKDNPRGINYNIVYKFISSSQENNSSLPYKETFEKNFISSGIYEKKQICQYLLFRLENYIQSKNMEEYIKISESWTIDHIMPQNINKWLEVDKFLHMGYVHSIGNLTLIKQRPNTNFGNDVYSKKIPLYKKSKIELSNKYLLNKWDEWLLNNDINYIEERSKILLEIFYEIFGNDILMSMNDEKNKSKFYDSILKMINYRNKNKITWTDALSIVLHANYPNSYDSLNLTNIIQEMKEINGNLLSFEVIKNGETRERLTRHTKNHKSFLPLNKIYFEMDENKFILSEEWNNELDKILK